MDMKFCLIQIANTNIPRLDKEEWILHVPKLNVLELIDFRSPQEMDDISVDF